MKKILMSLLVLAPLLFFFDNFSDPTSGWPVVDNAQYFSGYEAGEYVLAPRQPRQLVYVLPPYHNLDLREHTVTFWAHPSGPITYGVLCHRSGNNYYRISLGAGVYAMGKYAHGVWSEMTAPYWQKNLYIPSSGWVRVGIYCAPGVVTLQIGNRLIGSVFDGDEPLLDGDTLLFAASGERAADYGRV